MSMQRFDEPDNLNKVCVLFFSNYIIHSQGHEYKMLNLSRNEAEFTLYIRQRDLSNVVLQGLYHSHLPLAMCCLIYLPYD